MNIEDIDKIIMTMRDEIMRLNNKIEILQRDVSTGLSVSSENATYAPAQMPIMDLVGETEVETLEDCHTTRGFIYANGADKIAWTEFTWTRLGLASEYATQVAEPNEQVIPQKEEFYVVVKRTTTPYLTVMIYENLPQNIPNMNSRVLAIVRSKYNEETSLYEIESIKRCHVGDIIDVEAARNHAFKFTQISDVSGILTPGNCWVSGVWRNIADLPEVITVSYTKCFWVRVELYENYAVASWESGNEFPVESPPDIDTEIYPILKIIVDNGAISEVIQYQTSDIHALYRHARDPGEEVILLGSEGEYDEETFEDEGHIFQDNYGACFWVTTRVVYNHERSRILFGYQRKITLDKRGNVYKIGPEIRYEIDTAVPEP